MKANKKLTQLMNTFLMLIIPMGLFNCDITGNNKEPYIYDIKFSIKNETNSVLTAQVEVGKITNRHADFNEFIVLTGDEKKNKCVISPGSHNFVYHDNFSPMTGNTENIITTFIFTIFNDNKIIYRVVGWDVPENDMETYLIDDKMHGFFDSKEQDELNSWVLRRLTSKLFQGDIETDYVSSLTYYIRAIPATIMLQEMNPFSTHIDDSEYWNSL